MGAAQSSKDRHDEELKQEKEQQQQQQQQGSSSLSVDTSVLNHDAGGKNSRIEHVGAGQLNDSNIPAHLASPISGSISKYVVYADGDAEIVRRI